jgi:hypothetical protein
MARSAGALNRSAFRPVRRGCCEGRVSARGAPPRRSGPSASGVALVRGTFRAGLGWGPQSGPIPHLLSLVARRVWDMGTARGGEGRAEAAPQGRAPYSIAQGSRPPAGGAPESRGAGVTRPRRKKRGPRPPYSPQRSWASRSARR